MINVGYINSTYAEKRNIIGILPNVKYINIDNSNDINKGLLEILQHNSNITCFDDRINWFQKIGKVKGIDIIHAFNSVCLTKRKWVTTFETMIPRIVGKYSNITERGYRKYLINKGIESIKKDNCIKLIALSQNAYDNQKRYLFENCKDCKSILAKTQVLHPPQKMLIKYNELDEKFSDIEKELRFLFVGNAFWVKGGAVVCKILSEYRKYYPIKLIIISNFMNKHEHGISISENEKRKLMRWLHDNESWITCYKNLPNKKVLTLAKYSHIGLLPSYHETYGYSVLEMQASGCPVISTDIRAFPEINNNECGWLCKISKDIHRVKYCDTMNEEILGYELQRIMEDLLNNSGDIEQKGKFALHRIEDQHSPKKYAESLIKIYYPN